MTVPFDRHAAASTLSRDAAVFFDHGWLYATSGNLSVRRDAGSFLITGSGKHKGELTDSDFLLCNLDGQPAEETALRPSAETKTHCAIYARFPNAQAVYHVPEPFAALCSHRDEASGGTTLERVEMIKALGIWEEDANITIPALPNPADLDELAHGVATHLDSEAFDDRVPAVNLVRHGFYAWGDSTFAARRHVEALAYLFQYSWEVARG
jgi:methylthioribulose-1-phosphate dehydratase